MEQLKNIQYETGRNQEVNKGAERQVPRVRGRNQTARSTGHEFGFLNVGWHEKGNKEGESH